MIMKKQAIYVVTEFSKGQSGRKGKKVFRGEYQTISKAIEEVQNLIYLNGVKYYYSIDIEFKEIND